MSDYKAFRLLEIGFYFGIGFALADQIIWWLSYIVKEVFGILLG